MFSELRLSDLLRQSLKHLVPFGDAVTAITLVTWEFVPAQPSLHPRIHLRARQSQLCNDRLLDICANSVVVLYCKFFPSL